MPERSPDQTYVIVAPPRSASTALARVLWHHSQVRWYSHEPFGVVYHTDAPLSAAEDALRSPADLEATIGGKPPGARGLVVKEMTFQAGNYFPELLFHTTQPVVFNLRDPRLCIASRMAMRRTQGLPEVFPENETGWDDLAFQVSWCREDGVAYRIVDATELRQHPRAIAPRVLNALGLEYEESVLDWTPVKKETVQSVADQDQWYERILSADRLEAATEPIPEMESFPTEGGFRAHVEKCREVYQKLLADDQRISAGAATPNEETTT